MQLIPCITLKNYNKINYSTSIENISNFVKEGEKLYILDLDGIEKNKTNIELFQKISSLYDLWIDCGPRNIGDVVDIFMIGATSITIRKNLYPSVNVSDIKEISENQVYLNIDINDYKNYDVSFLKEYDGFVNFNNKEALEKDIEFGQYLNKIKMQNKIYCYENDVKNYFFWESLGVCGLLVDINKLKEFKNGIRA